MTNNVMLSPTLTVKDGKLAEFKALAAEMAESTEAEPGTLGYEWHISEDGKRCDIQERYANSAAAMVHMGGFGKFAERFMSMATPVSVTLYGNPDGQVKSALAGFQPTLMTQIAGFKR